MTALLPEQKERQRRARSRAGHIRFGMQTMADTFEHIARARAEADHLTLGYDTWQDYVDGEFGPNRVKLSAEKRNEYIGLLALAGASQREIAHTVGVSAATVNRQLAAGVSNETDESDGDSDSPAESPIVDALKQALDDATDRAHNHRSDITGEAETPARVSAAEGANCDAPSAPDHRDERPGVAEPAATVAATEGAGRNSPAPSELDHRDLTGPGDHPASATTPQPGDEAAMLSAAPEGVGRTSDHTAPTPSGPPCELCGTALQEEHWDVGYMRCEDCDPEGEHLAGPVGCRACPCPTCGQRMPT